LNHNKPDEAKKSIELALGKLETILSTENAPKLLPVDNRMVVKNFAGSADDVEKMVNLVKELLDKGKVQEAGELLISLQSEIDIVVVNLPLAFISRWTEVWHLIIISFQEREVIIKGP